MSNMNEKANIESILTDIIVDVSWANISKKYFGKSRSWLHHKIADSKGGLTNEERNTLKKALYDLASRIENVAHKL